MNVTGMVLPAGTRDIGASLMRAGRYTVPPASFFRSTTLEERALFGHERGMYVLPTVELVEWLREFIGDRFAVEIGAGVGVLARALGIMATDNYLQTFPDVSALYRLSGQPVIAYGANVEKVDADTVARSLRPDVILGAWITHKYDPRRHGDGGSVYAPDFDLLLANCSDLVLVCNERVHQHHPLMRRTHERLSPPWLYSRASNGSPDFIGVWRGSK